METTKQYYFNREELEDVKKVCNEYTIEELDSLSPSKGTLYEVSKFVMEDKKGRFIKNIDAFYDKYTKKNIIEIEY